MKTTILSNTALAIACSVFLIACKKESSSPVDNPAETIAIAEDEARFTAETDAITNEANMVLELTSNFSNRPTDNQNLPCDASMVLDTVSNPRTVTVTYNGSNCRGDRTRTGVVIFSLPQGTQWKSAGAELTVKYENVKCTRASDNKSISFNGTIIYKNVNGGLLSNLATLVTITHTITSNGMTVTFDNGSQASWQIAKQRQYTFDNGIVISTTGMHSEAGKTGIAEWGLNRFAKQFYTTIAQPMIIRQNCNFRLVSGNVIHETGLFSANVTFGLDQQGNPTTCPATGSFYMKIVRTGATGNTTTTILPY